MSRTQDTLHNILKVSNQLESVDIIPSWRLNERHCGALTGLNKAEVSYVRSYDVPPAPMEPSHPFWSNITQDKRYEHILSVDEFPRTESIKTAYERFAPYWRENILPEIKAGKNVIIVAHANMLRGLIKEFDYVTGDQVVPLHLRFSVPFVYEFDENFNTTVSLKYLW